MDIQKYMLKHSELELKNLGVQGRFDLRKNASDNEDLDTLQDVATYRFVNGSVAIYIDLLPELAYLYGKAKRVNDLKALFNDYSWAMFGVPQSCIEKTNNMFAIGYTFPYLNENQLDYLEDLWCDSSSFEWMDIIMYDSYMLPRKLNRFDKSQLEIVHTEFSDEFLYEIYNGLTFVLNSSKFICSKSKKVKKPEEGSLIAFSISLRFAIFLSVLFSMKEITEFA